MKEIEIKLKSRITWRKDITKWKEQIGELVMRNAGVKEHAWDDDVKVTVDGEGWWWLGLVEQSGSAATAKLLKTLKILSTIIEAHGGGVNFNVEVDNN